jgi:hypothetical protein
MDVWDLNQKKGGINLAVELCNFVGGGAYKLSWTTPTLERQYEGEK